VRDHPDQHGGRTEGIVKVQASAGDRLLESFSEMTAPGHDGMPILPVCEGEHGFVLGDTCCHREFSCFARIHVKALLVVVWLVKE
jgi:hypothetical protein